MIIEAIAISDYTLAVCYCSDCFYRLSIVAPDGRVFDFDDIYYDHQLALNEGKAIIRIASR